MPVTATHVHDSLHEAAKARRALSSDFPSNVGIKIVEIKQANGTETEEEIKETEEEIKETEEEIKEETIQHQINDKITEIIQHTATLEEEINKLRASKDATPAPPKPADNTKTTPTPILAYKMGYLAAMRSSKSVSTKSQFKQILDLFKLYENLKGNDLWNTLEREYRERDYDTEYNFENDKDIFDRNDKDKIFSQLLTFFLVKINIDSPHVKSSQDSDTSQALFHFLKAKLKKYCRFENNHLKNFTEQALEHLFPNPEEQKTYNDQLYSKKQFLEYAKQMTNPENLKLIGLQPIPQLPNWIYKR